jgi:hypothetical protein
MRISILILLVLAIAITMISSAKLVEFLTYYSDSNKPASGALVYVDKKYAGSTNNEGKLRVDIDPGNHSVNVQCTLAGKYRYDGQKSINVTNGPMNAQLIRLSKVATRTHLCPACSD